jgi:FkbM family methyltransferase
LPLSGQVYLKAVEPTSFANTRLIFSARKVSMNASRNTIFRQLPIWTSIAVGISILVHKICDKDCASSYAQCGEDRLLLHAVQGCHSNYYVDLGCNRATSLSNTYLLYQMGWHGLCVDANEEMVEAFRRARPKDRAICVCVGETAGEISFSIAKDPALSHVAGIETVHERAGEEVRRVTLAVKTVQDLLELNQVPERFGLLSIDLEGLDFIALRSFDIRRWRPYLILIEIHGLDLEQCGAHEIVKYLREAGYRLVAYNMTNAFFRDCE